MWELWHTSTSIAPQGVTCTAGNDRGSPAFAGATLTSDFPVVWQGAGARDLVGNVVSKGKNLRVENCPLGIKYLHLFSPNYILDFSTSAGKLQADSTYCVHDGFCLPGGNRMQTRNSDSGSSTHTPTRQSEHTLTFAN